MNTSSWVDLDVTGARGPSPSDWSLPVLRHRCNRLAAGLSVAVLAVTLVVLLARGWEHLAPAGGFGRLPELLQGEFAANMISMATTTALSFFLCGLAVLCSLGRPTSWMRRFGVPAAAALVVAWGSYVLAAFALRHLVALPTDGDLPDAFSNPPMSAFTAAIFLAAGLALLAAPHKAKPLFRTVASVAVCGVGLLSLLILLAYAHNIELLKEVLKLNVAVAPLTATTFLLLAVGLAFALGPDCFPLRPFVGPSPRPMMLRSFLPVVVGFLLLDSLVRGALFHATDPVSSHTVVLYSAVLCLASLVVTVAVVSVLAARIGGAIEKAEEKRDDALVRMARTIDTLERTRQELAATNEQAAQANRLLADANRDLAQARHKAEQAAVEKDFFLATVSHELRTPLNHVIGFLQLLEMTDLDDEQQRDLTKIHRAAHSLLALVNDLLDYQKMIQGSLTLEPGPVDLVPWVEELADSMTPKALERGNQLLVECPPDFGTLEVDEKRLRQALTNLLSNSAKFTRDGVITMRVRREADESGEWLLVDVQDTGRGMSPEEQAKLFQPFTKLVSRGENPDGTGLGLAISQRLCRLMGGDLTLSRSALGQGSTFTVRLPVVEAAPTAPVPSRPAAPVEPTSHRKPLTILVIDDDPEVRELMSRHLEDQGFVVHLACNGSEGLEMVKRVAPDAITLDVLMPGIDGWGTLAALQADAETAHIPVIMVTLLDDRTRGFALGAWEVLTKPVSWVQLIDLLHTLEPHAGPVLLVDDDPAFRALAERTLNRNGWEVCCAEDGRAALAAAARRRPVLVLLDLLMPLMDGFAFLEAFRQDAVWRDVPVVVVTAKDLTEEEIRRLNGSVLRILSKGRSSMDELLREVERLLLDRPPPALVAPGRGAAEQLARSHA